MKLEVISRKPKGKARPTPLMFVHGAYGGAWIWDQHLLPYFAEHGYEAHALSLRGHGASEGWESLPFTRLRHYVEDLEQTVAKLKTPPALIGHSMGGMVVQKYLHKHPVPAAVLMASVPPHGMVGTFLGMAFTDPGLFRDMTLVQTFGPSVADGDAVRRALFSEDTPDETIRNAMPRMQAESTLVILDLMGLDLPPSLPMLDIPVLVLGAEKDAFVFRSGVEATAKTYRTKAEIFPRMAHAMMLEHGWEMVADRTLAWLDETLPPEPVKKPTTGPRRKTAAKTTAKAPRK
jgi:pimeloyl-ACP methyl ester carboxylesterase